MRGADKPEIPGYDLVGVIGRGASGTVYRGLDLSLDRSVAIKVLNTRDDASIQRFLREARIMARLAHHGIAQVINIASTQRGDTYIVQELVEGVDLSWFVRRYPRGLPERAVVHLLLRIAETLEYAHAAGVVHRDIKPGNVRVKIDGSIRVLDFGLARKREDDAQVTMTGELVGTPTYMPPEVLWGQDADWRSDIYALGAVGFELLTGQRAFHDDSSFNLMTRIVNEPARAVRTLVPSCASALADLIDASLKKDPADRPQSMSIVVDVLKTLEPAWDESLMDDFEQAEPAPVSGDRQPGPFDVTLVPAPRAGARKDDGREASSPPISVIPVTPQLRAPTALDPPTEKVGRFTLHERIASGRSGDLYKAWDPVRGRLVAVKVIPAHNTEARHRLLRGGRIWIDLQHPNIVRVLEVHPDYDQRGAVIVSEIVDGVNLDELCAQRHIEQHEAAWIVVQLCEALSALHKLGVVHREVKPRNVLVAAGDLRVTLLDSGIARHANPEVDAFTQTGVFVGDLSYAAPEQSGGRIDHRTDIYSMSAVLYEIVTRRKLPFPLPPDWSENDPGLDALPARMRRIIERGLSADPASRFASVFELRDHLMPLAPERAVAQPQQLVVALHGIRTQAAWQRAFAEVAGMAGLGALVDRWNFGYFSSIRFLMPWARLAKVRWFRETYQTEFKDRGSERSLGAPSIVAHSFGTYILGNALLRYPYLKFDKVLLCGSILPVDFPWDRLIERGQVQSVRNEFGREDVWTRAVGWFVAGTGPSGLIGFSARHPQFEQEQFDFAHSEYFERGHMQNRWVPFLSMRIARRPPRELAAEAPRISRPWGLYGLYLMVGAVVAWGIAVFRS
jgi:serine/threonine-protein kinase